MRGVTIFFCLLLAGCGGPAGLGGSCDVSAEQPCADEGAICADDENGDPICQLDYGTECNPDDENNYGVYGSECVRLTELDENGDEVEVGRCYVVEGGACDPEADTEQCSPELTCAEITDGTYECHEP